MMNIRLAAIIRLAGLTLAVVAAGGCASVPAPCPAVTCPPCEDAEPSDPGGAAAKSRPLDLSDRTPQLDRGGSVTLEAMSADGTLALLDVYDSARGRVYRVVELATEKTKQTFDFLALGERAALKQGLKALGAAPVQQWSSVNPTGNTRAFVTESAGRLVLFVETDAKVAELANLPRHTSPGEADEGALAASVSNVTVAWAPDGTHVLVVYRQTTLDRPSIRADRWFSIPVKLPTR